MAKKSSSDIGIDFFEKTKTPELPDSFQDAADKELSEVLKKFKDSAKKEAEIRDRNTNTDFWFCVYFADQAQRDEFLSLYGLLKKLSNGNTQYINGNVFAKAIGAEISEKEIPIPKAFRKPAGIDDLIMDLDAFDINNIF